MERKVYRPKIDWWIYLVLIIMVCSSIFGLMYDGEFVYGLILGLGLLLLWLFAVSGVKYEIKNDKVGIRNFYCWTWLPIDKITTVEMQHGIFVQGAVSATLSLDCVKLTLSDRSVLKSSMPIYISPNDRNGFIARLKSINPDIQII